jgi:molecular chaperone DnaK
MVSDAEAHRSEDAALRTQVDARNELDTVAYQVRRTLEDNAAAIPEHERARADLLLNDARNALEGQANVERLRALTGEMHQILQSLAASARAGATAGASAGSAESSSGESGDDSDDVIDAEFTAR